MTWSCAAIDHGVAIFPNGKIGPCCKIKSEYLKPISQLSDPNRFADLKTEQPPTACHACVSDEHQKLASYRSFFNNNKTSAPGLQFVDIRNTNLCNLKCRYCGPHFSSKWAHELNFVKSIQHQLIDQDLQCLISNNLHWLYFTGGEPLISQDHWNILQQLIDNHQSQSVELVYNSNLTTLKFKDIDIESLWQQFKKVTVQCSIDAIGQPLEYIRSDASWQLIEANLQQLMQMKNVKIVLSPVISILNFWFLPELLEYANRHKLQVQPIVLTGPDYLALDVIPDQLKNQSLELLTSIKPLIDYASFVKIKKLIQNNINQTLFAHTINHVLLLDNIRNEKLFDLLPFKNLAIDKFIKNYEYDQR